MKKIVIQVHAMGSEKCRSKAMQIAAVCQGVQSVGIEGESRDQLVVTGDGVDSVCLTNQIRKKFRSANIISVGDVKPSDDGKKEKTETEKVSVTYYHDYYPPPYPTYYVCEPYPSSCFFF